MRSQSSKKGIFITYSSFEENFVKGFKRQLEKNFDCEVFAFKESLKCGDSWLGIIREHLAKADLHIIILSPISVRKPWTYFESGGTWVNERTKPISMRLCLSGREISEANPLSKLWHGDFFKDEDIGEVFDKINKALSLSGGDKKMFIKGIIDAIGDEYKILNAFKKIMEKDVNSLLHKRGIVPVPAVLREAFGEDWLEGELGVKPKANGEICTYNPGKTGKLIRCFESLCKQEIIERVEAPLQRLLRRIVERADQRSLFLTEVIELLSQDPTLKPTKESFSLRNIEDMEDIIAHLQTSEAIEKMKFELAEIPIIEMAMSSTTEWFNEYAEYFTPLVAGKGNRSHSINAKLHQKLFAPYKDLRKLLLSWYRKSA